MVIWPKIVAAGDEGWDKACALLRMLPLDTRRRHVGRAKGEGFIESAEEFLERPNIWVDKKLVPAPYYAYRLDFAVSCSVQGAIPAENEAELTEFKRVVTEAMGTDITLAERNSREAQRKSSDLQQRRHLIREAPADDGGFDALRQRAQTESEIAIRHYRAAQRAIEQPRRLRGEVRCSMSSHEEILQHLIQQAQSATS
jgi:hypothetical protein